MPVIAAYQDHPSRPYVRVETNWADVPSVTKIRVLRVDATTGVETALRPYVCYDGDCIELSCGHAIFWDTEAPFDTTFFYRAEPCPDETVCVPADPVVTDSFTRITASGFGTADSGQSWTVADGTPANHSTNGTVGVQQATAVTDLNLDMISGIDSDVTITVDTTVDVGIPTGGPIGAWIFARYTDISNHYLVRLDVSTSGNMILQEYKRVGGVLSSLAASTIGSGHVAGHVWRIKFQVWAPYVRAKAWNVTIGQSEPAGWNIEAYDVSLTTGDGIGVGSRLESGNTDVFPVTFTFDNFIVSNPCLECVPIVAETAQTSIASGASFWLKDPVRPCRDREVMLHVDGISNYPGDCTIADGIIFNSIGTELYGSNSSQFRPLQRRRPIPVVRQRRDAATVLNLTTSTFTAREDVIDLVVSGSPLLFQAPTQYGIADRYMHVGDVSVDKISDDTRFAVRTFALPYETVDRPVGPTQGICGNRVADLCDVHSSWDSMEAANITYEDILRGKASLINPVASWRDWTSVDSTYVDWDAVDAANTDWTDVLDGA